MKKYKARMGKRVGGSSIKTIEDMRAYIKCYGINQLFSKSTESGPVLRQVKKVKQGYRIANKTSGWRDGYWRYSRVIGITVLHYY